MRTSQLAIADRSCVFCASELDPQLTFTTTERMYGFGGSFQYGVCSACGSFRLLNVPARLDSYYPQDEYWGAVSSFNFNAKAKNALRALCDTLAVKSYRHAVRLPKSLKPSWAHWYEAAEMNEASTVLDFGCGNGSKLQRLIESKAIRSGAGYEPYFNGRPPTQFMVHKDQLPDPTEAFSVVIFNHSLEHLIDPLSELKRCIDLLAPDGRIIIRVPLTDSIAAESFGSYWSELDAPRHVSLPSSAGVAALADRARLKVLRSYRDGEPIEIADSLAYAAGLHRRDPEYCEFIAQVARPAKLIVNRLNERNAGGRGTFVLQRKEGES